MDLARPSGIVVDGSFLKNVIPDTYREAFKEQKVYLRSIAEDNPTSVLYLADYVRIPDSALNPMRSDNWRTISLNFTIAGILKMSGPRFRISLEALPISTDKVRVNLWVTNKRLGTRRSGFSSFKVDQIGPDSYMFLDVDKLKENLAGPKLGPRTKVRIEVHYVPRPLART